MLVRNGIEVREASGPVNVGGRQLPAEGTFIVPMAQPTHRFARNLLDPHVPMAEDFVQRQIERRARREPDQIYDLTAWSQSLLWDVEAITVDRPTGAAGAAVAAFRQPEERVLPAATVGYLLPWGTNAAAAVAEALREGVRVRAAGADFTLGARQYPIGTAIAAHHRERARSARGARAHRRGSRCRGHPHRRLLRDRGRVAGQPIHAGAAGAGSASGLR